jgi:hypothetical protein
VDLLGGLEFPLAAGWRLWTSSLSTLVARAVPIAAVAGVLWQRGAWLPALLLTLFSALLARAILLQRHVRREVHNPYALAARQLIPWVATVALVSGVTVLSMGFLGPRALWADEFSVIRRTGPFTSLMESWYLTKGVPFDELYLAQLFIEVPKLLALAVGALLIVAVPFPVIGSVVGGAMASLAFALAFLVYGVCYAAEVTRFYGLYVAQVRREMRGAY